MTTPKSRAIRALENTVNEDAPLLLLPNRLEKIFWVLSTAVGGDRGTNTGGSVGWGVGGPSVGESVSITSTV